MAVDRFQAARPGLSSPADRFAAIIPNDGADVAEMPRALFIGGGGNLVVQGRDGVSATFIVGAGQILPIRAARVMATGTTASDIVGLF